MTDGDGLSAFVRAKVRAAGRQVGEARAAYAGAKRAAQADLPTDDAGRARIVCRRYAQRRAVRLDGDGRPECYEDHPDCRGCVEDLREGVVETW